MFWTLFPHCSLAMFILSCSLPVHGRPAQGINGRVRRAVSEHQYLHDKGRAIQELRRRIFLQNLMGRVNTAGLHMADEALLPATSVKNYNTLRLVGGEEEGVATHLTQETQKSLSNKELSPKIHGKKKKGKPGKRKDQDKRKRQERSPLESLQDPPGSAFWLEELDYRTQ